MKTKELKEIVQNDLAIYMSQIIRLTYLAKERKNEFLNYDFNAEKQSALPVIYASFYIDLCLFPDKEVLNKFKSLGLKTEHLKWFIQLKEIDNELIKIGQNGKIFPLRGKILMLLISHLEYKIVAEISDALGLSTIHDGRKISMIKKILIDIFRRRDYADGNPKYFKSITEIEINNQINHIESKVAKKETFKKEIFKVSQGDTNDPVLSQVFSQFLTKQDLSESEFCNQVYDFFRLILKDDPLMFDEDQFLETAPNSYRSYRIYRHKRIKDLFIKKK